MLLDSTVIVSPFFSLSLLLSLRRTDICSSSTDLAVPLISLDSAEPQDFFSFFFFATIRDEALCAVRSSSVCPDGRTAGRPLASLTMCSSQKSPLFSAAHHLKHPHETKGSEEVLGCGAAIYHLSQDSEGRSVQERRRFVVERSSSSRTDETLYRRKSLSSIEPLVGLEESNSPRRRCFYSKINSVPI